MICVLALLVATSGFEDAQLRVERPRPILAAIRILEERYGWTTNYEDAPYTNPADIVEFSPTFLGARKIIEPRSGRIEITYPLVAGTGRPESQEAVLQMVIDDHARRENAGRFHIRSADGVVSVVPAQGSILDVPIKLSEKQRTFQEVVEDIVSAIHEATGLRFRSPLVARASTGRFRFGASDERASQVLLRLFHEAGGHYSWVLLYIPEGGFELSVQGVN